MYMLKRIETTDVFVKSFRIFFFDDFHRVSYFNGSVDLLGCRNIRLLSRDEEQRQYKAYEQDQQPHQQHYM